MKIMLRSRATRIVVGVALAVGSLVVVPSVAGAAAAPTITGISPARGPLSGGAKVRVVGTGFTSRTTVTFGNVPATKVTVESATSLIAQTPKHAAGTIHTRVTTSGRTSTAVTADRFFYTSAPSALKWKSPLTGNRDLESVSCSSAAFCVTVGTRLEGTQPPYQRTGVAQVYRSASGLGPLMTVPDFGFVDVSCVSTTFCLAADGDGGTTVFDGTRWGPVDRHDSASGRGGVQVSCASSTFCVVATGTNLQRYDGTSWSVTPLPAPRSAEYFLGVGCASASFCLAVTNADRTTYWNGRTWSAPKVENDGLTDFFGGVVSCPTATFCVIVTESGGQARVRHGTTWSPAIVYGARSTGNLEEGLALDCSSDNFCAAMKDDDERADSVATFQSAATNPYDRSAPVVSDLSCPTDRFCAGVGNGALYLATR